MLFFKKRFYYSNKDHNCKIIKLNNKTEDIIILTDTSIFKLLKTSVIIWDVSSVKVFDLYLSKSLLSPLGLYYTDDEILQSLQNYNSAWYNVIKQNNKTINTMWQVIYNNHSIIFKKKYSDFKIILSYIFLQSIIGCFYSIGFDGGDENFFDDFLLKALSWVNNYDLINNGYKIFKFFSIILSFIGVCTEKNTFSKNILYIVEILCINKQMKKKIKTTNNKSNVFFKLTEFEYHHSINFKISLSKATCFEFENNLFKIEKSIYSVYDAIHENISLQERSILNIDALLLADCTEFKINKDYLGITKEIINNRLKRSNKTWESVINKFYLKNTLMEIKKLNKKILIAEKVLENYEFVNLSFLFKSKLKKLAINFSEDLIEFETISFLEYLESKICYLSIYFIFFLDFRGRMYTVSSYGPTSNKIIRNILVYNSEFNLSYFNEEYKKSKSFQLIKNNYFDKLNIINLKNNSDLFKISLFWVFISLASFFKNSLLEDNKVSIDKLLKFGIDLFLNKNNNFSDFDIEEEIELRRNIFIAEQLVEGKFDQNTFLCKDSTASVFQHLFIYLQPKDLEALKICNIVGDDSWHDPYSFIINKFLENKIVDGFIKSIFNRKTLKKSIMTHEPIA